MADPANSRRKLSYPSRSLLRYWLRWAQDPPLMVRTPSSRHGRAGLLRYLWFPGNSKQGLSLVSEKWSVRDLSFTGLELSDKAQSYFRSTGTDCFTACSDGRTAGWADACAHQIMVRQYGSGERQQSPLHKQVSPQHVCSEAFPFQLLFRRVIGRIAHTCELNEDADMLSRWSGKPSELPDRFPPSRRIPLDLEQLWFRRQAVTLWPSEVRLPWRIPMNDFFM